MSDQRRARVCVVTGGSRGIGAAIASVLTRRGHVVALLDKLDPRPHAEEIVAAGGDAVGFQVDLTDLSAIQDTLDEIVASVGPPLVLVNNAGVSRTRPLTETSDEDWSDTIAINLTAPFHLARSLAPHMLEQGWGRIVNVASSSIYTGSKGKVAYMASKAGLLGLTSALANDLGPAGVTVNAVSPGFTRTPMVESQIREGLLTEEVFASTNEMRVVPGSPDVADVAELVGFLASDDASAITAQFIAADGGLTRHY